MGKLQSFLQLGGVFADFAADAPAVASTYPVNRAAVRPRPGAGLRPAKRDARPGLGPGLAGSRHGPWPGPGTTARSPASELWTYRQN